MPESPGALRAVGGYDALRTSARRSRTPGPGPGTFLRRRTRDPLPDHISANKRRSALLIATVTILAVATGWAFDVLAGTGVAGRLLGASAAVVACAIAFLKGDAIAVRSTRARPADPVRCARLHNLVESLCAASGVPKPRVYVVEDLVPNAFTTGRDARHATVIVTTGLLDTMNRVELEAVLAHELSHVRSSDILPAMLATTLLGWAASLAEVSARCLDRRRGGAERRTGTGERAASPSETVRAVVGLPLLLLVPLLARAMRLAVPRERETVADLAGASLTRYPPALASALEKLGASPAGVTSASRSNAPLWIVPPLGRAPAGRSGALARRLSTHPPVDERVDTLRAV